LAAILWENDDPKRVRLSPPVEDTNNPVLLETERQLDDYFAGKRKKFSIKFDFAGTDFQKESVGDIRAIAAADSLVIEVHAHTREETAEPPSQSPEKSGIIQTYVQTREGNVHRAH
jgi:hypothetical protein